MTKRKKKAGVSRKAGNKIPTKKPSDRGRTAGEQKGKTNNIKFPVKFPFWARLKISKNRTTLVIDQDKAYDKAKKQEVDGYVHREATSVKHKGFEEIKPNPDKDKSGAMYLKSPRKLPKYFFEPHNKCLDMPESLKKRYEKNNHKDDSDKKE